MKAFLSYLGIQMKIDLREKGILMNFYLIPLVFFFVLGAVFSSITPQMKATLAATMTIFALTMGAVMGTPGAIVKMQESGTLRAFRVNGIPSSAVLTVQALGAFLHLLIVSIIIYLAAPAAFHSEFPKNQPLYFGVLAVFLAASIGIGMLIGVFSKNQSVATMLSMAVFLPTMLLSGIMFPASMLPESLVWVGRVFPATHALQTLLGLAYQTKTDWNAGLSFGIVAGIGILAYFIAAIRFNRTRKSEQA